MSDRCFCPCHTHPGTYPPPCGVCGHDNREGRMIGGYRDGWEPVDPRDARIATLNAQLAARGAEVARLRDDAFTANDLAILYRLIHQYTQDAYRELPKEHSSHATREALRERVTRHLINAREIERAALAAPTSGDAGEG